MVGHTESGVQSVVREKNVDALEALVKANDANQVTMKSAIEAYGTDAEQVQRNFAQRQVVAKQVVDQVLLGNTAEANQVFINTLMPKHETVSAEIGNLYTLVGEHVADEQTASAARTKSLQRFTRDGQHGWSGRRKRSALRKTGASDCRRCRRRWPRFPRPSTL